MSRPDTLIKESPSASPAVPDTGPIWGMWSHRGVWLLAALWVGWQAWHNTVFSDSFAQLTLRELDDYAFHAELQYWHSLLKDGQIKPLLGFNSYGYGALFWWLHGLATLPMALLKLTPGVIAGAREVSLAFVAGSLMLFEMMTARLTAHRGVRAAMLALLLTFPALGFAATRFHNHAQVLFFITLAWWCVVWPRSLTRGWQVGAAVALAAALGTKLNGLFGFSLVGLYYLDRIGEGRLTRTALQQTGVFLSGALGLGALMLAPLLPAMAFLPKVRAVFLSQLGYGIAQSHSLWGTVVPGVGAFAKPVAFGGLWALLGVWGAHHLRQTGRWLGLGVAAYITGLILYIWLAYHTWPNTIWRLEDLSTPATYFIPVCTTLALGMLPLAEVPVRRLSLVLVTALIVLGTAPAWWAQTTKYATRNTTPLTQQKRSDAQKIQALLAPHLNRTHPLTIVSDYRVLLPVSPLDGDPVQVTHTALGPPSPAMAQTARFVFLSKLQPTFQPPAATAGLQEHAAIEAARGPLNTLMTRGKIGPLTFRLVLDTPTTLGFERVETP